MSIYGQTCAASYSAETVDATHDKLSTQLQRIAGCAAVSPGRERGQFDPEKSVTFRTPPKKVKLDITFGTGELKGALQLLK